MQAGSTSTLSYTVHTNCGRAKHHDTGRKPGQQHGEVFAAEGATPGGAAGVAYKGVGGSGALASTPGRCGGATTTTPIAPLSKWLLGSRRRERGSMRSRSGCSGGATGEEGRGGQEDLFAATTKAVAGRSSKIQGGRGSGREGAAPVAGGAAVATDTTQQASGNTSHDAGKKANDIAKTNASPSRRPSAMPPSNVQHITAAAAAATTTARNQPSDIAHNGTFVLSSASEKAATGSRAVSVTEESIAVEVGARSLQKASREATKSSRGTCSTAEQDGASSSSLSLLSDSNFRDRLERRLGVISLLGGLRHASGDVLTKHSRELPLSTNDHRCRAKGLLSPAAVVHAGTKKLVDTPQHDTPAVAAASIAPVVQGARATTDSGRWEWEKVTVDFGRPADHSRAVPAGCLPAVAGTS